MIDRKQTMKKKLSNKVLWLVVGLPVASVAMGIVTIFLALQSGQNEHVLQVEEAPLSKTSWSDEP